MHALPVSTRISLKNILMATDFSLASKNALPFASALAQWYGSKIFVIHVVPLEPYVGVPMEPMPIQTDVLWNNARRLLDEFLPVDMESTPREGILRRGDIWTTISGTLRTNSIDLLVIGTHGRQGLKKVFMGSVAESIYRQAPCPVLTVGPEVPHNIRPWEPLRILFPTDFSPTSLHALPYALSLAEERQGTLILLHTVPLTPWQYQEAAKTGICQKLENLVVDEVWCKFEFVVEFEYPAETILNTAGKYDADLIVIGVNKAATTTLSTHLPWSIASQVVGRAHCPVLTVRG